RWNMASLDFWDDFSTDGKLENRKGEGNKQPVASLAVQETIPPHSTKTITFLITWHFPNRVSWANESIGNYYTTKYKDAWEVAESLAPDLQELEAETMEFVNTFLASDIPEVVKEAALFNVSTLRSQTVFRIKSGQMFGYEGCNDQAGCCIGSCTHVWNYEQATPFLFGDLARSMREVEFGHATNENGLMSFRVRLPLENAQNFSKAAADGQLGCLMKIYREWHLSGDNSFLAELWPGVKRAMEFCWIEGGWDADKDGVMEGSQHNTMDVEYYGPNPQMQAWYLGALKATELMALHMGEKGFAKTCHNLFIQGSEWTDQNLFNGEYYEHQIRIPEDPGLIAPSLRIGMGALDMANPDFQLGAGCLVDQLVGQYFAHIVGLGYLLDKDHVQKTLNSIMKYNYREDLYDHFNFMRSYALGNEPALLMASYPKERPKYPFPYFTEVMTGFEYTAAIGMLYEGQMEDGLKCIQNIRDRYDGLKRNPFDEAECGHHYARAMASWAGVLALSGFQYSGIEKSMQFTSKPGNYFWSNGSAWGNCIIEPGDKYATINLSVLHGALELDQFKLGEDHVMKFKKTAEITENAPFEFQVKL
ncbi:MAG: GH116 family glycosyl hydrolase, partial [Bacteroides sp.]|nr:GH116 family glycosyl hydrolase [Bacteroides sp.]